MIGLFGLFGNAAQAGTLEEAARDGHSTATLSLFTGKFFLLLIKMQVLVGVSGQTDKYGRPLVFSQPAAVFNNMMRDSKGRLKVLMLQVLVEVEEKFSGWWTPPIQSICMEKV